MNGENLPLRKTPCQYLCLVMKQVKKQFPVIDICSLTNAGGIHDDIIAQPFADYLKIHPNLHHAHRHTFYHLVLFTKGGGSHTIDFEQFKVRAGQMYFMIPGQVHSWNFIGEVDGYIINFSEQLLKSFLADQHYVEQFSFFNGIAHDGVIQLSDNALQQATEILKNIINELSTNEPRNRDMICMQLATLLITVSRDNKGVTKKQVPPQNQLILHNFRKLVDEHYSDKKLPKEYAALLYITPNHLNALCNDLLGKPAGEVIRDRVLLEAKRLLINKETGIAEIAYQLGFTDNSYFTKFFRKYEKMTSEEFRKTFTDNTIKQ